MAAVLIIAASFAAVTFGFTEKLGSTSVASEQTDRCVVDSVEFNPADVSGFADSLGSSCVIWLDASQTDYSDTVDEWEDLSPNGFDFTGADAGGVGNPSYNSNVDGIPAVEFDRSVGEGISTTVNASETDIVGDTTISTIALVYVDSGDSTILQVGRPDTGDNEYFRHGYNDAYPNYPWFVFADIDAPPGPAQFYGHKPEGSESTKEWKVVSYVHDGSRVNAYVDGQARGGKDGRFDIYDGAIQIGYETDSTGVPTPNMEGAVAELVVYEKALSDDEREAIECTLDSKYGSSVTVAGC